MESRYPIQHHLVVTAPNATGLQLLSRTVPPPLVLMLPETMVAEEQRQRLVEAHAQVGHDERVGGQAIEGRGTLLTVLYSSGSGGGDARSGRKIGRSWGAS